MARKRAKKNTVSFSEGNHDEKGKINAGNAPKWGVKEILSG
jgi:hypothetical protein